MNVMVDLTLVNRFKSLMFSSNPIVSSIDDKLKNERIVFIEDN